MIAAERRAIDKRSFLESGVISGVVIESGVGSDEKRAAT